MFVSSFPYHALCWADTPTAESIIRTAVATPSFIKGNKSTLCVHGGHVTGHIACNTGECKCVLEGTLKHMQHARANGYFIRGNPGSGRECAGVHAASIIALGNAASYQITPLWAS